MIGTHFEEYTGHVEKRPAVIGEGTVETDREMRVEEQHDFAEGEFYKFDPGECVVTRQGEEWVHGRVKMLRLAFPS